MLNLVVIFVLLAANTIYSEAFTICATDTFSNQCNQLQRGKSEVNCQRVQDSVECALRIINETADFGVFSAESTLHIATLGWEGLSVVKSLVHNERTLAPVDFESVVVIKGDLKDGLAGLKGRSFCHPGIRYGKPQRWSEQFAKHFERKVVAPLQCNPAQSPAEQEVSALASFFGKSCHPGKWSHDMKEDAELKQKYPSLCELCPNQKQCDYFDDLVGLNNNHQQALSCLKGKGEVAYVTRQDAELFFQQNDAANYKYLCPNGTLETPLTTNNPCVWLRQPWGVIMTNVKQKDILTTKIDEWLKKDSTGWEGALKDIIETDSYKSRPTILKSPNDYISMFREMPPHNSICDKYVTWCTTSSAEKEKCRVIRAGGISAGVYPYIKCGEPLQGTMECMTSISKGESDFMGIDSNFGYMARRLYNLTAAMYFETEPEQYSSPVVVLHSNSKYKKFEDLKGSKACMPEFGATPTIAFINQGKERNFLKRTECRYGKLLKEFFGSSCAPGADEMRRYLNQRQLAKLKAKISAEEESLCSLCLSGDSGQSSSGGMDVDITVQGQTNTIPTKITCAAEENNRFYGNRGALKCLKEVGDVAILELQSLKEHAEYLQVNENDFQIICRNGSIQQGLRVDLGCALTTIVDGEIIVERKTAKFTWVTSALTAFDRYFQYVPDFKMYNIFDGKKHLLFKDSTIGLTSAHEKALGETVENYIKLFKNLEDCVSAGTKVCITFTSFLALLLLLILY